MAYKVLYRRYRPDCFENVVGQDYTVKMLKNAISSNHSAHAYIFTGPRGVGKTSCAKIFAKALNCENPVDGSPCGKCNSCLNFESNPDIIEIDAASNNGVDEIRELINNVKLVPSNSKYKVYIIDEVHMLTTSAFNALLLTLEEPPSHVVFILATTDIQDVPITILSRCQRFDFRPISRKDICDRLRYICDKENISASDDGLNEIALIAAGGMRDALGMLDQLSASGNEVTQDVVSSYFGSVSEKKIDELLTSILDGNTDGVIEMLGNIKASGTNYSVFVEKIIDRLRKISIDISNGKSKFDFCYDDIYDFVIDLNDCLCNININVDPYIIIEMVLLKNLNRLKSKKYFPGNNVSYDMGNNLKENTTASKKVDSKPKEVKLINKKSNFDFDINVRINNCFFGASKEIKGEIISKWIEFMNFLIKKDRNLVSLLADSEVLAASDQYILISSPVASTASLINEKIGILENLFKDFDGNSYRFAALDNDLWKKEVEKYRNNVKNKIKYIYMEENIVQKDEPNEHVMVSESSDIEDVAKDIFGSYDVE